MPIIKDAEIVKFMKLVVKFDNLFSWLGRSLPIPSFNISLMFLNVSYGLFIMVLCVS
jgi:hypothetical protein